MTVFYRLAAEAEGAKMGKLGIFLPADISGPMQDAPYFPTALLVAQFFNESTYFSIYDSQS